MWGRLYALFRSGGRLLAFLTVWAVAVGGTFNVQAGLAEASTWPFIENGGRYPAEVAFTGSTRLGTLYITTGGELIHAIEGSRRHFVVERFDGGTAVPRGGSVSTTRVDQFLGANPARWGRLAAYDTLILDSIWPGVCTRLRVRDNNIERLFELAPGAESKAIRMSFDGVEQLALGPDGCLRMKTPAGELELSQPVAWQVQGERVIPVEVAYLVDGKSYGFVLGPYDERLPVMIDPLLRSTFVGGTGSEAVAAVAVGADRVYAAGTSSSLSFPVGPLPAFFGSGGVFVAAYSLDLTQLLQVTILGGGTGGESVYALAATNDAVYLAGKTASSDFPGTATGAQTSLGGAEDGFVARLSLDLTSLERATYLGGTKFDDTQGLAIGAAGVYVTGNTESNNLPATTGAAQAALSGASDAYAALLAADLTSFTRVTYLGGGSGEANFGDPALSADSLYVVGETLSSNFPQVSGGYQSTNTLSAALAFVARLSLDLTQIVQSTYFGDNLFVNSCFQVAFATDVFLMGRTNGANLPGTAGGAQSVYGGSTDLFVARFAPDLTSLVQATYLGGTGSEEPGGMLVRGGDVFVGGGTSSTDFPNKAGGFQPLLNGSSDGFLARLNTGLTQIVQASYLGGTFNNGVTDIDEAGGVLFAGGDVADNNFPGTATGAQTAYGGGDFDGFLSAVTIDLKETPVVNIDDVSKIEGNTGMTGFFFTVSVTAALSAPATVTVSVLDGTAHAGEDYTPFGPTVLTFQPNGPTSQTVTVQVLGDEKFEPDETFLVMLSMANGIDIGKAAGAGKIVNDDRPEIPMLTNLALAVFAAALALAAFRAQRRTRRSR